MRVRDLMKRKVVTVTSGDSVRRARFLMEQHGVRHIPVVDGKNIAGMVSERDLYAPTIPGWNSWEQVALDGAEVATVMSTPPATLAADDSANDAANLMRGRKIGSVLVVGADGRLVGIITTTDILEAFSRISASSRARTPARVRGSKRALH